MTAGFRSLLLKFLSKLAFELVPAGLASVAGGLILAHYQASAPKVIEPAKIEAPASEDLRAAMTRLNDEHDLISDYLKDQQAAEERKLLDEKRAAAQPAPPLETPALESVSAPKAIKPVVGKREATPEPKLALPRRVAEPAPKLQLQSQPRPVPQAAAVAIAEPLPITPVVVAPPPAPKPRGIIGRTIDMAGTMKDRTFATVGSVRDFFTSAGERIIGGGSSATTPPNRLVSNSW